MVTPDPADLAGARPQPSVPTEEVCLDLPFDSDGLYVLRASVAAHAGYLGASTQVVQRALIVASELATNAVRHGGGRGRLRLWVADGRLYCQVTDSGRGLADVMAGIERPEPTAPGGRGLWISRQLVDEFAIDSGPDGTTARFAISLDGDAIVFSDYESA
jgi:anti-sigma regulatory factor (Ser/Thr protein kinase)